MPIECQCPLCFLEFEKSALSLPCGHMYCEKCVKEIQKDDGTVSCPCCETKFDTKSSSSTCIREIRFEHALASPPVSGLAPLHPRDKAAKDAETIKQLEALMLRLKREKDDARAEMERRVNAKEELFRNKMLDRFVKLCDAEEKLVGAKRRITALEKDVNEKHMALMNLGEIYIVLEQQMVGFEKETRKELDMLVNELKKMEGWKTSGFIFLNLFFTVASKYLALFLAFVL